MTKDTKHKDKEEEFDAYNDKYEKEPDYFKDEDEDSDDDEDKDDDKDEGDEE